MMQESELTGRGAFPLPPEGEVQPLSEFALTLVRYLPAITAFMVLSVGATFLLTAPDDDESRTATVQIGLTNEVVWPFYDATRERVVATVSEAEFVEEVDASISSGSLRVLKVDRPDNQAYVRITATADSPQAAADAANAAADLVLATDNARLAAGAQAEVESLTVALISSEERVAEADVRIAELVVIEADARAEISANPDVSGPRQTLLAAEDERSNLTQVRNEELRRQVQLRIDVDRATQDADIVVSELEVLGRAAPSTASESRSATALLAAALGSAVLGIAAAIVWDRTRGRLWSRWHAEQLARVPLLADIQSTETPDSAVSVVAARLLEASSVHGKLMAVSGLPGVPVQYWTLLATVHLERAGVSVLRVTASTDGRQSGEAVRLSEFTNQADLAAGLAGVSTLLLPVSPSLVAAPAMRETLRNVARHVDLLLIDGGTAGEGDSEYAALLADATALVAHQGQNSIPELRAAANYLRTGGTHVLGVVLDGIPVTASTVTTTAAPQVQPAHATAEQETAGALS